MTTARCAWRGIGSLLALAVLLSAASTAAQEPVDEELVPPATFVYESAAARRPVRAVLEFQGLWALGLLWYVTSTTIKEDWDLGYDWQIFRDKLAFRATGFDKNHLGTNFIGHPLGGTGYYLAARSNHLGIVESFAFAVAGSTLWELYGEITEPISINDMIVTPVAGLAIGESSTQLGAFFDRSSPALHNRVLGVVFGPLKTVNDLLDGLEPARDEPFDRGFPHPRREWHRFDLGAELAATRQKAVAGREAAEFLPEFRLRAGSRLARLPNYDRAGRHALTFADANVSSMELELALGERGLVDLAIYTQVMLVGYYQRHAVALGAAARAERTELHGSGLLLGLTTGFGYTLHDFDRDGARPVDRIAGVQPLGVLLEHRAAFGRTRLGSRLAAGGDFGGVSAYALQDYERGNRRDTLPYAVQQHRYYFGGGGHLATELWLSHGRVDAELGMRSEAYTQIPGLNSTPRGPARQTIEDFRARFTGALSLELTDVTRVRAFLERRLRGGRIGSVSSGRSEISFGAGLGARF